MLVVQAKRRGRIKTKQEEDKRKYKGKKDSCLAKKRSKKKTSKTKVGPPTFLAKEGGNKKSKRGKAKKPKVGTSRFHRRGKIGSKKRKSEKDKGKMK